MTALVRLVRSAIGFVTMATDFNGAFLFKLGRWLAELPIPGKSPSLAEKSFRIPLQALENIRYRQTRF